MRKRSFSLLLALLLVLLCGCDGNSTQATEDSMEATGSIAVESTGSLAVESTGLQAAVLPTEWQPREVPAVEDVAEQIPAYEGELLVPYDPDRQIYIPFRNQNIDFYPDYYFTGITGYIISKEHYAVEEIRVNVPAKTEYEVVIYDLTGYEKKDILAPPTLEDYQYLCLQGIDWQAFSQLAENASTANRLFREYLVEMAYDQALSDKYTAYREAYLTQKEAYESLCEERTREDNPFAVYSVSIRFTDIGAYEETVESIEFQLGKESYTIDIGQWRLHKELPAELAAGTKREGLNQKQIMISAFEDSPYNGGYVQLSDALSFTAAKDLTITGVRQFGVEVGMLGGKVRIEGETDADYYWDLQRPLDIAKGDSVNITLYLKDDRFAEYEVGISNCIMMDYEINGKAYTMNLPCLLARINYRCWDTYLMAFEGYDMGEYYTCYYNRQHELWMQDLPEEWLQ